ncbi:hypothetical protein [Paenibacillus agilis]|uniref:DUF4258 domain-containing protein n=1 Tax=Paenibacillus agilis TaxID=3020863 RepID=A0A559ID86_9BACL|nr:hypothetical protein [Paenibacillus agilis]TVX85586.1 hypothetical protein FPZ44_24840 [Paenibacillus agilis]
MFPEKTVFSHHAKLRCKQRGIDMQRIKRQLLSKPYAEGSHDWVVPNTPLQISYQDTGYNRTIITVILEHTSVRSYNKDKKKNSNQ